MMMHLDALSWVLLAIGVRIEQFAHLCRWLPLALAYASTHKTRRPASLSPHLDTIHLDADGPAAHLNLEAPLQVPRHLLSPCQHRPQRSDDLSPVLLINGSKRRLVPTGLLPVLCVKVLELLSRREACFLAFLLFPCRFDLCQGCLQRLQRFPRRLPEKLVGVLFAPETVDIAVCITARACLVRLDR